MRDGSTLIYSNRLFCVWHCDPETDGTDDSCGWFKRARHGDPATLERIVKAFEFDWDRTYTYDPAKMGDPGGKSTYLRGYFSLSGVPRFSVGGVLLNLIFTAAFEHFKRNHRKARRFMRKYAFDVLFLAENPTDSLFDSIALTFGKDSNRDERVRAMAQLCYGWVIRQSEPWWRHPRWHVHHWRFSRR